ncbi:MAG: LamG-like jellyroll fold domain-containing protein, partial [Salegentibacter sp.]
TGTIADLTDADKPTSQGQVNTNNWVQFYSNPFWNSGDATTAVLEIIDLNTIRSGNDFGLDDISFGTLERIKFEIAPSNNSAICEGEDLKLFTNREGGKAPFQFKWYNPDGEIISTEENPVLSGLSSEDSGTYTLEVTDFYGCNPVTGDTEVTIIPETIVNAGEDQSVCAESPAITLGGSIEGSVTTGRWSGGTGNYSPNPNALDAVYTPSSTEINSGEVVLVLTSDNPDAPCQPKEDTVVITINPTPVIDNIDIAPPACYSGNDASASVQVSGGTPPYSYLWSNGQTTQTATGLSKTQSSDGLYVTVTDASGCEVTSENLRIEEPTPLKIEGTSTTPVSCYGGADGTATIEINGGYLASNTPDYNIILTDNSGGEIENVQHYDQRTLKVEGLGSGSYTFTVSTSCAAITTNIVITQPDPLPVNAGEIPDLNNCGTTSIALAAELVPSGIGVGKWSFIASDGGTGHFSNDSSNNTTFYGEAGKSYQLLWTVAPVTDCPPVTDTLDVLFPEDCSKLDFDGIDDYVLIPDNSNKLDMGGNSFTVEAWIKPKESSLAGIKTILSKKDPSDDNTGYALILNDGAPSFLARNRSVLSSLKLKSDRWYHLAGVFEDNANFRIYVDGILMKSSTNMPGGTGNVDSPLTIGATYDPASSIESKDHFSGWIEEIRLWDRAISEDQIHFLMNQRIDPDSSPLRGEVLPLDVPGNLTWNDLLGYYRLIALDYDASDDWGKYGVKNGITPDLSKNPLEGQLKNITSMQENTAPLPYTLFTDNKEWFLKTSWNLPAVYHGQNLSARDVWDPPSYPGINTDTIAWNIVDLNGNTVLNPGTPANTKSIELLGLLNNNGTLQMEGENNSTGNSLTITHYLGLGGSKGIIDLDGDSQLIQPTGSIAKGTGHLEIDQQGTASSYNYNYWSSPVIPAANSLKYKVAEVMFDGSTTGIGKWKPINFNGQYWWADGAKTTPIKISDYWINTFRKKDADQYSDWEQIGSNTDLLIGEGYTMKGTSGNATISDPQNYTFKGFPNNGTITLENIGADQNYLIGNPYPSAISADEFILDHLKVSGGTNTQNVFNGTLYYWDHFSGHTHYLQRYVGGYAMYNLSGPVRAIATDDRINTSTNEKGYKVPGPYIPVGQAFFINTANQGWNSETENIQGGDITFKNKYRAYVSERDTTSIRFLKPVTLDKKSNENKFHKDNRYKIRLNFHSPTGYDRELLVTADANASNGYDLGYDAPLLDNTDEDMFWLIGDGEFVIQGVPNFNIDQVLPIGMMTSEKGMIEVKIAKLENIPAEINIYLRDNSDSSYYNLRKASYQAELEAGYHKRYDLVFNDGSIVKQQPGIISSRLDASYADKKHQIKLDNPELLPIEKISVYNIAGQLVETFSDVDTKKSLLLDLKKPLSSAIYIIKVFSEDESVSKKIIVRR